MDAENPDITGRRVARSPPGLAVIIRLAGCTAPRRVGAAQQTATMGVSASGARRFRSVHRHNLTCDAP